MNLQAALETEGCIPLLIIGIGYLEGHVKLRMATSPEVSDLLRDFPILVDRLHALIDDLEDLSKPPDDRRRHPKITMIEGEADPA